MLHHGNDEGSPGQGENGGGVRELPQQRIQPSQNVWKDNTDARHRSESWKRAALETPVVTGLHQLIEQERRSNASQGRSTSGASATQRGGRAQRIVG